MATPKKPKKKKREPVSRSTYEAYCAALISISLGWASMTFWPRTALMVILSVISADLSFRSEWTIHRSPITRSLILTALLGIVFFLSKDRVIEAYRQEFIHDTFPFLNPVWNSKDEAWILNLTGFGPSSIHSVHIVVTDMMKAQQYVQFQSTEQAGESSLIAPVVPSDTWIHTQDIEDLKQGDMATLGHLITLPTLPFTNYVNYVAKISVSGTEYEENIKALRVGDHWAMGLRLVDITNHLNLIHCLDPELGAPYISLKRLLKDDRPCNGDFSPNISKWEKWQHTPDIDGQRATF